MQFIQNYIEYDTEFKLWTFFTDKSIFMKFLYKELFDIETENKTIVKEFWNGYQIINELIELHEYNFKISIDEPFVIVIYIPVLQYKYDNIINILFDISQNNKVFRGYSNQENSSILQIYEL